MTFGRKALVFVNCLIEWPLLAPVEFNDPILSAFSLPHLLFRSDFLGAIHLPPVQLHDLSVYSVLGA